MKKLLALILALSLIMVFASCAKSEPTQPAETTGAAEQTTAKPAETNEATEATEGGDSKGKIVFINYHVSTPYFQRGAEAAVEAGKKLGYEVIYTGTSMPDTPAQISMVEDYTNQGGVVAMIIAAGDSTSMAPSMKAARDKGIKVITWDLDTEPDARDYYAGLMELKTGLGIPLVESIVKTIGTEGEYAIITGVLTNEFLSGRVDACIAYQEEKYPDLECVAVEGTDEDMQVVFTKSQNLISTYPNLKAIMSNIASGWGPIAQAIEQEGKIGEVYACGQSVPSMAVQGLESGAGLYAELWDVAEWAEFAVKVAANAVEGTEMPDGNPNIDGYPEASKEGDILYYNRTLSFTKDNVNDYDF
jgi:ABC-type sugar transport system substrate-binding protein